MTQKIAILSGKGGVGKTFTSLNLAAALSCFNKDVILVDGNLTTPNISVHLGAPNVPVSLHDVLKGKNHITEAVYSHHSGIKVVPGSIAYKSLNGIKLNNLKKALYSLDGLTDIIIIDGAPGLTAENIAILEAVNNILIVTNPELPALTDALKTIKMVESYGKRIRGVILTKTGNKDDITFENVEAFLGKKVLAEVPEDKKARESLVKKGILVNLFPRNKVAISYKKLAADLINEQYFEEPEKGFFERFFSWRKD
ncbi:P-loop NTPase [Candidatus Woesearchaeota archaeon]|nr:P-loop NTPase [Candidatus Woesearchaeota archaeon]